MPTFKPAHVNKAANCGGLRRISVGILLALSLNIAVADEVSDVQALLASGKSAEGLKKIDQLLTAKPSDPRLRLQRGIALSLLNRPAEAISVFQKLIESHPELPGPYNNLAVLYGNQGDYEKARQSLELAIRTNPSYATAFQNLGDVYARLAGQAYKKALALDKSDGSLPLKLAVVQNIFEASVDPRAGKTGSTSALPVAAPTPASTTAATAATATLAAATATAKASAPTPAPTPTPAPAKALTTAPAITAASTPAPAAKAAAAAKPEPARADAAKLDQRAVEKALQAWTKAWSERDMFAYYAAYAPEFKGKSATRKAWEEERRIRITGKKKIVVTISDIRITVNGDKATLRLRQDYNSDALSVKSAKTLEMVKNKQGDWQITAETAS
jgi:Flp pilus assembly protein TadD/ketosteroid isomerase-like protein